MTSQRLVLAGLSSAVVLLVGLMILASNLSQKRHSPAVLPAAQPISWQEIQRQTAQQEQALSKALTGQELVDAIKIVRMKALSEAYVTEANTRSK